MEYEICYLIGESKEANLDKIRPIVEKIIKKNQGTFLEGEFVKKRRLAYEIEKEARGTYVARRFTLPSKDERIEKFPDIDFISEITNALNFEADVLRFIIVKADELLSYEELEKIDANTVRKPQEQGQQGRDRGNRREVRRPESKQPEKEIKEVVKEEETTKEEVVKEKSSVKKEVTEKKTEDKVEEKKEKKEKEKKAEVKDDDIDEKLDEILSI